MTGASTDAIVLGSGPGALAIAAAMAKESLRIEILTGSDPKDPWPFTYGIWGEEVDDLGLSHLLEHRWKNTVSFFGSGDKNPNSPENKPTNHGRDYGLFNKIKLQHYWIDICNDYGVTWHRGFAVNLSIGDKESVVTTKDGKELTARLVIDATGYEPVFLKHKKQNSLAVQTCYGVVGKFNTPPVDTGQFVLMDYRSDHLSLSEQKEPPTFLYAMDMGGGSYFLEETSLGLAPPLSLETLQARLESRLAHRGLQITRLEHEEIGLFLPMNIPIPDLDQPVLGFGGSAGMVHPASGYMVGALLRRSTGVAKVIAERMNDKNASPAELAKAGWKELWPRELRRKQALYQFGLEKLMRFTEPQLREFFKSFFKLENPQWFGFLTNTLTLKDLVKAMVDMFIKAPWSVKWGLMGMQGRELKLLWNFIRPSM